VKIKKVIICGGTGFIGKCLAKLLKEKDYFVSIFTRNAISARKIVTEADEFVSWDYRNAENLTSLIDDSFAVVNLTGASLSSGSWTKKYKREIYNSRIVSTQDISNAINSAANPPKVLFNASAVGYYGHQTDEELNESAPPGDGFLATVCKDWENSAYLCAEKTRVVTGRFGIVLSKYHGALQKQLAPYKFYLGGPLGTGLQWYPWIHIDDLVSMILWTIEDEKVSGPVNFVSPNPVRMKEMAYSIGNVLDKPSFFRLPEFALKFLLGEMASIVINGQRALPMKALEYGYHFKFDNLNVALADILNRNK